MIYHEKKINSLFFNWLNISLMLIFFIIIIGGLTRLTNSGLSITEWELFSGILPPLNNNTWENYFNLYKEIPQYKLMNYNMSLSEFKIIFYWEYFHRILARFIGMFFLLPLIYFYLSNKIKTQHLNICYLVFILIIMQGVVGWYMVKSGLINNTTVSHYRLSIHLFLALNIISILFWLSINIKYKTSKIFFDFTIKNLPFLFLIIIIFIQVILGAFVSGLDAGKIYQTWPMMGSTYFPNDIAIIKVIDIFDFNDRSLVQFYHRNFAYFLLCYILSLSFYIYKNNFKRLYNSLKVLLTVLFLQIVLGIYTLVSGLNIYLASSHQITSVVLVFSAINLYYFSSK